MTKKDLGPVIPAYPMPIALVGANVGGRPNYLAVAWFTVVDYRPVKMAMVLGKAHYTNPGIRENGSFSINIPSRELMEAVDYCGITSGKKVDKSILFKSFYGKLKNAPMIEECPVNVECKLLESRDAGNEELFIGEVVSTYIDEGCLTGGTPDFEKIKPFIFCMTEDSYRDIGEKIGEAWKVGRKYRLNRKRY